MDYSPEDLQLFQKYGVSPDTHELDRNTWEFVPKGGNKIQPEGELATFARSMAGGAGPAIGAGLGGTAGTVAGTALAPLAGPAAPIVPAATGIVGGVVGGQLGGKAQHAIAEAVAPDLTGGWNLQEEANAKENPKSAFAGTLASMLLSNQLTPVKNLKGLQGLFTAGGKAGAKKTAQQMAINAGIGSGMEAANQVLPNVDWNKNNMGLDDVELEPSKIAMAGGANLLLGDFRKPFHAVTDKLAARGPAAIKAASEKLAAERGATSLLDDATKAIKSPTKIKTTPEGAATIEQQFRDVVDPASSRAAVFVPEGTTVNTKLPDGLVEVKRPDGVAFVNPQKGADIELIRTAPEMPGDALGMSQQTKPADGTDVVVGEKGGNEVSAEVVNGNDPAAVKAAAEAASNASPGADVSVKPAEEVLFERMDATQRSDYLQKRDELIAKLEAERERKSSDIAEVKNQTDEDAPNAQLEAYEKSLQEEEAAAAAVKPEAKDKKTPKAKAPPVIKPLEGKISQAWYDLWKRAGFDKYGVRTDTTGDITMPNGKLARGQYNPDTRQVDVDLRKADFDNQPHELFHAWLEDVAQHGNSAEKAFAKKMLERFGAEEPGVQATGEHAVSRAKGDDSFLKDALAFVKYKVGRANERDFARLASNEMYRGRGFKGEVEGLKPTVGGVRNQPDDDRVFVTDFEKELNANPARPFKIQVAKDGRVSANDIRAALAKAHPVEQELLKQAGIDDYLKQTVRPTPSELATWIKENGPRVETLSYGQQGKVSKERMELDQLTHEWWDNLSNEDKYQVQRYKLGERFSLPETLREKADRYIALHRRVREESPDTSPRATHFYNQVSPKDTKKFPVQRVDVVLNKKLGKPQPDGAGGLIRTGELWSPDGLHENVPNTIGWAAIQYETLPSGEKVAHVYEAQGRWPQQVRKAQQEYKLHGDKYIAGTSAKAYAEKNDHPLLKDYNRLILKAAIDEARKNGATKIAISDAETAMMSERHDQHALKEMQYYAKTEAEAKAMLEKEFPNAKVSNVRFSENDTYGGKGDYYFELSEPIITQEGGMRFNYDNALPRIAEELTGSKGEPVNFGEHKNAVKQKTLIADSVPDSELGDYQTGYDIEPYLYSSGNRVNRVYERAGTPRDNLIFRNPDGTPKTDVTARMYDISNPAQRRATGEPYGLVNKRYQAEDGAGDTEYKTPSKAKTPILSSNLDLLRRSNDSSKQSVGNALANAWHERAENQGRYENMVMPLVDKLSKVAQKRVLDHWIETQMTEMDTPIEGGTPQEQAALDAIREMYRQVREDQNAQGMLVRDREGNEREGRFDPTGMPHLIDPDVHSRLKNEQGSEWWHSIIDPYRESLINQLREKHQTGRKNPISDAEIESIADAKIRNITGAEPMRGGTAEWKAHSKPLRLAESTKLTPEMIDTNLPRLLEKYIGQVSKDLAFHKYVESKPEIAKLIGEVEDANPRDVLAGNTDVAGALSDYRGDGIKAKGKIEKALGSVSDLAVALLTANPVTRGADFITTAFRGPAAAENPFQIPQVLLGMLKNVASGKAGRDARDTGLIRNMANYMDNLIGNTERVKGATRKIATGVSKGTGSERIENATRTMAQAYGDVLARIYVESARNGDKTAIHHLEQIAPDGEWATLAESDQGIARLATRIAKEFQGVYNNSNLSPHMTEGPAAPMLRMSKWSVEQANNFRKYQLDPLLKHGDAMPLAMYLAVMAGGSAAVQEFREWASGRKSYTPTWAELGEGKDGGRVTSNAIAKVTKAFESVGVAGAYMNLANMAAQAMAGQQSQEIVSPMVQAGTDMTRHAVQGAKAVFEGQDPSLVIPAMIDKMAQSQISMFRIARNWALNSRAKSIRENARDFSNFKLLQGDEKKPFLPIVSYDKMDEKEFDKADLSEAGGALRNSVRRQAFNDPSKLPKKIKDLGVIASTGEGPSLKDEEKLLEYIAFIKKTQGADRARQVYRDLIQRDAERKAKREMVGALKE